MGPLIVVLVFVASLTRVKAAQRRVRTPARPA
jgi:hypothetical protein